MPDDSPPPARRPGRLLALLDAPLPAPPDRLRLGPFRGDGAAAERAPHDVRTARLVGTATGVALLICMVTGLISHFWQHAPGGWGPPSRPVWGYQVTQGLHVATGIALVPLVLAKLWVVFPKLFTWPPARTVGHGLERALIAPLVAGTLFQLVSGLLNVVQWYPWSFFFPKTHWAVAWVVTGAVLIHLAVKAPLLRRPPRPAGPAADGAAGGPSPSSSRRAVLVGVGTAVGVATVVTVGQTLQPVSRLSLLAPRRAAGSPQGVPINRTAHAAGVAQVAVDPGWRLTVAGTRTITLSLADLAAMAQDFSRLPIACVEGWSATASWSGVRLSRVLDLAGIAPDAHLQVVSLESAGLYARAPLAPPAARDPLTLLALRLAGQPLTLDHGFPLRLIAPDRPGVQQTKWLSRIELAT